jgi:hypothetical protein
VPSSDDLTPRPVRLAALVVAVEAAALVGFAVYLAISTAVSTPDRVANALALAVIAAAAGVLLGALARSLAALRVWARTPVVVLQIVSLPVGVTLIGDGRVVAGALTLLLAVAVLYLLFTPAARAVLDRDL